MNSTRTQLPEQHSAMQSRDDSVLSRLAQVTSASLCSHHAQSASHACLPCIGHEATLA